MPDTADNGRLDSPSDQERLRHPEDGASMHPDDAANADAMPALSKGSFDGRTDCGPAETTFEGYQIIEELPQGGQAIVYKAIHKATKAKVALKVLLPGLTASMKARQYFKQEVELAASLSHPNIVAIRDSGIARGQYYFAMNYIHGQPLDRYLQSKGLSIREKLILFGKICDAMKHAHQRGVIHRDLKPSNILVDERGEPHILDFGLAKTAAGLNSGAESTAMPTITGQIKGTVTYMSPEQAAGRSDLVDVRSDVYSLGVILYQMCTGRLPYDVLGTIFETLQNVQHAEPARPRQWISRFDSDVEAVILKCLAKDPNLRYQSAAELGEDVRRWLDGLPIVAKSVSSIYLLRKIVSRHRYTATVMVSLLTIIVSFSAVSLQLYRVSERRRAAMEATSSELSEQSLRNYRVDRRLTFLSFLETWRQGNVGAAAGIAQLVADDGSKEKKGAMFLLQTAAGPQSEEEFRRSIGEEWGWFADFIMAEKCARDGRKEQAERLYRASYQGMERQGNGSGAILDRLLEGYIKTRLVESVLSDRQWQTLVSGPGRTGGQ